MATTIPFDQLSDIPEGLRDHAVEADGKYTVSVEFAGRVKEFRDNNVEVSKERDSLKSVISKYEQATGVNMDLLEEGKLDDFVSSFTQLKETSQRVQDGKLVEETSLEEASASRVAEVHNSYRSQLSDSAKEREAHKARADAAEKRANSMVLENAVRIAAGNADVGMLENAVQMILPQAHSIFRVDDKGGITPKDADGTVIYGQDGMSPMSIKEWLLKQRETNDFLFKGATGGGSQGSNSTDSGKMSFDQMQKANMRPELRMQMAREGK